MPKLNSENLFLLEFLVDSLCLNKCIELRYPSSEKCVSFEFLDNISLEVCEADFSATGNHSGDDEFIKNGKSCLFSLRPEVVDQLRYEFNLNVQVYMKSESQDSKKIELGSTCIPMQGMFDDLVKGKPSCAKAKSLRGYFEIFDEDDKSVGGIALYIRMSFFGNVIVTQFQMNMSNKSVLFKDKEGKSLYRYKRAGSKTNKTNTSNTQRQSQGVSNTSFSQSQGGPKGASNTSFSQSQGFNQSQGFSSKCSPENCQRIQQMRQSYGAVPNQYGYPTGVPSNFGPRPIPAEIYGGNYPSMGWNNGFGPPSPPPGNYGTSPPPRNIRMTTPCSQCRNLPDAPCRL